MPSRASPDQHRASKPALHSVPADEKQSDPSHEPGSHRSFHQASALSPQLSLLSALAWADEMSISWPPKPSCAFFPHSPHSAHKTVFSQMNNAYKFHFQTWLKDTSFIDTLKLRQRALRSHPVELGKFNPYLDWGALPCSKRVNSPNIQAFCSSCHICSFPKLTWSLGFQKL